MSRREASNREGAKVEMRMKVPLTVAPGAAAKPSRKR
jgi:hypothetical protein